MSPKHKRVDGGDLPYQKSLIAVCLIGFVICVALLVSGCSVSRTGTALNVGVVAAKVADQMSTDDAEARGFVEANPILGSQQWRQIVIGAVGVAGVIAVTQALEKQSPLAAHLVRGIVIVGWSAVAYRNWRITQ
jgi:uncharacterized protein YceK